MDIAADTSAKAFFDTLLSRQSHWSLNSPGPGDAELDLIFDAALRAPDHAQLRPWRFVVIRNDSRAELAKVLFDIAAEREPETPGPILEQRSQAAYAAPVIIALGAHVTPGTDVPEIEQLLAVGAATMNMLNAIHALGYGGVWATGSDTYDTRLRDALDFEPNERLLGFLLVGSRVDTTAPAPRPSRSHFIREWFGRTSV